MFLFYRSCADRITQQTHIRWKSAERDANTARWL